MTLHCEKLRRCRCVAFIVYVVALLVVATTTASDAASTDASAESSSSSATGFTKPSGGRPSPVVTPRRSSLATTGTGVGSAESHPRASGGLGWQEGTSHYSTVHNCLFRYTEPGVGVHVGYYGDPLGGIPQVATQYTWVHLVVAGLGNNCVGHWFFPSFDLPADVAWYKNAEITCYYNGSPMTGEDCPQWSSLLAGQGPGGSDRYDHPGDNTWGVPPGGIMEFLLPVWAPQRAVRGANMTGYVELADGENFTPLTPTAPLWFFGTPPKFCNGQQVTVDYGLGQRPTAGRDVVFGTSRSDTINTGGGDDVVCASAGNDVVNGGTGADTLNGGDGADTLNGGDGADTLNGGAGRDRCRGALGTDRAVACEVRSSIP